MGTANFYNHPNGIFVLRTLSEKEARENLLDRGYEADEITDDLIDYEIDSTLDIECTDIFQGGTGINYFLETKGFTVENQGDYCAKVFNKQGKLIAELSLESGYYEGVQLIVETNQDKLFDCEYFETNAELMEVYSPHHRRLIKAISQYTLPLGVVGSFSNGEAIYTLKEEK